MLTRWLILPFAAVAALAAPLTLAADIAVPPLKEAPERITQGLMLTIESAGVTDRRSTRLLALNVPKGTPPTPFMKPGPFSATWEGDLFVKIKDDAEFIADGRGTLKLEVNGTEILNVTGDDFSTTTSKKIQLKKGKNRLIARYTSPAEGEAFIRMNWKGPDYPKESLPIVDLSHNADFQDLRVNRRVREGREVFASMRCNKCHAIDPGDANKMPELDTDAPSLADAGARLHAPYMAKWIENPRTLRPDATMPQVLHGATAPKDAIDLAAFLATLGVSKPEPDIAAPAELIAKGGDVIAKLGCIGCHTLPEVEKHSEGRVPFRNVRFKWKRDALKEFLQQPDKHYAWIRMPNFRLSKDEVEAVTAFLLFSPIQNAQPYPVLPADANIARGKELAQTSGCISCHNIGTGGANAFSTKALKDISAESWTKGCMAPTAEARGKAPDHYLDEHSRGALLAFAATDRLSLFREALPEYAERRIKTLRCFACHRMDDKKDLWTDYEGEVAHLKAKEAEPKEGEGEEGHPKVEQHRPQLTWVGEKLKPEWMTAFIGGKIEYKPRPWVDARMPGFPRDAVGIARGLVQEHAYPPVTAAEPAPDAEKSEIGKKLTGENGGLACTKCHSVGVTEAVGVFEAPGINLMYAKDRLTKTFFLRWINDPMRVEKTQMPKFAEDGKTQLTEYYDGDAWKQYDAIWNYLLNGDKIVAPEK